MELKEFTHVFVIAMSSQLEELKSFNNTLPKDLPITIEPYPAVDGNTCTPPTWWKATPGAWGCYRSHLNLIERALNEDWNNLLLFEVDAGFCDNFVNKANAALAELPPDWECLYLGGQMLHTNYGVARYVSEHLVKPYNCNRTHAWAINKTGLQKIYNWLSDHNGWPTNWHFDHRLGQLHQDGRLNVYACYPFLVAQNAGKSTTMGREETFHDWNWGGICRNRQISKNVKLIYGAAGFGNVGFDGQLGYEDKKIMSADSEPGKIPVSLHAPSTAVVEISGTKPIRVYPRMSDCGGSARPVRFIVNTVEISRVQAKGEIGAGIDLIPGRHEINLSIAGGNVCAMSYLVFVDESLEQDQPPQTIETKQERRVVGIEIITNAKCQRNCPGCNQSPLMSGDPNYEFTTADARALLDVATKHDVNLRLFFSGGEPALWSNLESVMMILNASDRVIYTQVATSCVTASNVTRLKKFFDQVCCSIRKESAQYLSNHPDWLDNVRLWDQRYHAIDGPAATQIACACAQQGIQFCLVGQECWPCTLAKSNTLTGLGKYKPAKLNTLLKKSPWPPIANYNMCKTCSNNSYFRSTAKKLETL